jgi:hypothetical protein
MIKVKEKDELYRLQTYIANIRLIDLDFQTKNRKNISGFCFAIPMKEGYARLLCRCSTDPSFLRMTAIMNLII